MTFKEATDLLAVPLERVAEVVGRSYATVLAYRTGDREPPPEVLAAVARLMREQSATLNDAAAELERA